MRRIRKLFQRARLSPRALFRRVRATAYDQLLRFGWKPPRLDQQKTAYVIGLLGSGRWYLNELIMDNLGPRAKYFRDVFDFRFHPAPTSMIYSGHCTLCHESFGLRPPAVTRQILEAVQHDDADLIFIYRHPLDSLLTNWAWCRALFHQGEAYSGISQIYRDTAQLCTDLEQNFPEFLSFAAGGRLYYWARTGTPFLSFSEFVEETELYVRTATLALRLEDFMTDPNAEFARLAKVLSVDLGSRRGAIALPRSRPYRYRSVIRQVPRFRRFVDALDPETRKRIEIIGYTIESASGPVSA